MEIKLPSNVPASELFDFGVQVAKQSAIAVAVLVVAWLLWPAGMIDKSFNTLDLQSVLLALTSLLLYVTGCVALYFVAIEPVWTLVKALRAAK